MRIDLPLGKHEGAVFDVVPIPAVTASELGANPDTLCIAADRLNCRR